MGVGAGLYMYVVVVQKFTFAISSPDEFLYIILAVTFRLRATVTSISTQYFSLNEFYFAIKTAI